MVLLWQKAGARGGPPQRHLQYFFRSLAGLGIAGIVAQHAVGRNHVVYVVRAFFAAFNLPRNKVRNVQQGFCQHVQRKVEAREPAAIVFLAAYLPARARAAGRVKRFAAAVIALATAVGPAASVSAIAPGAVFAGNIHARLFLAHAVLFLAFRIAHKGNGGGAALTVHAAAGLHAAATQAAFAAHVARPVAAARNAIAQCAVHKAFKVKAFGAGLAHHANFVDGKFARQNNPVSTQLLGLNQAFGMGEVGQSRKKKTALIARLTRQIKHGQILHDETVGAHLTGQTCRKTVSLRGFARLDQGVHGHIDARVFGVRKVCEARKFGEAKVFCLHAGRKMFEPQIDGVCPGGKGRQE